MNHPDVSAELILILLFYMDVLIVQDTKGKIMRKNRYKSIFKKEEYRMEKLGCVTAQKALDIIYNYLGLEGSIDNLYSSWSSKFLKEVEPYEIIGTRRYYYCTDVTIWLRKQNGR
jgi:hypothetical protein